MTAGPVVRGVVLDFGGVLWNMCWDVAREIEQAHALPGAACRIPV